MEFTKEVNSISLSVLFKEAASINTINSAGQGVRLGTCGLEKHKVCVLMKKLSV